MSSIPHIVREIRIVDGMDGPHGTYGTGDKCVQIGMAKVRDYFQESGVVGSLYLSAFLEQQEGSARSGFICLKIGTILFTGLLCPVMSLLVQEMWTK